MNQGMLKKLQQMQKDMVNAQKELEASTFFGTAAGGSVSVEFTGNKKMQKVTIDFAAFTLPDDQEILEDTILAAVNDCMQKIDEETEATMGQFSQGLGGLPGMGR
jgi:DNA-binding YbaB/EbfC family protein